jgi:hypothetical protein
MGISPKVKVGEIYCIISRLDEVHTSRSTPRRCDSSGSFLICHLEFVDSYNR